MTELITMGFNVEGCKRAVYHTQNLGKEEDEEEGEEEEKEKGEKEEGGRGGRKGREEGGEEGGEEEEEKGEMEKEEEVVVIQLVAESCSKNINYTDTGIPLAFSPAHSTQPTHREHTAVRSAICSSHWTELYIMVPIALAIVHPESFRSNAQNVIAFARRNRPLIDQNDEFACVYLRLRACVCVRLRVLFAIDRVRACICAHVRI